MGSFVTAKSRIEQTDVNGYWKTIDNELYLSTEGTLYLTPRHFWTDGYTFPRMSLALLGDKNSYDVRPCHAHDLFCRFHEKIIVNLSISQLRLFGLLREKEDMTICENIPKQFLIIEKVSKNEADNIFKEMMLACDLSSTLSSLIRAGVFFNINWLRTGKKSLNDYELYEEDIGLVNGF